MSRSQPSYAPSRTKTSAESHPDTNADLADRFQTHESTTHELQSSSDSRSQSGSRSAPVSSVEPISSLAELRVGDHVTWRGRSSTLLVVDRTLKRASGADTGPDSAPSPDPDHVPYKLHVTVRSKTGTGGEYTLVHCQDGIRGPLPEYPLIEGLCRLTLGSSSPGQVAPRHPSQSPSYARTQSTPAADSLKES